MKNISIVLNVILLAAVAWLFFDRYSAKKPGDDAASVDAAITKEDPLRIVHINIDTLHNQSTTFQQKKKDIEKRQKDAEASLQTRVKAFQKELAAYQQKIQSGNITPKEAQEIEQSLAEKEQKFQQEQERLGNTLMTETEKFNEQFNNQVRGFLDSLKKEMRYDYILIYGAGGPILTANDTLDVTQQVLEVLNKKQ